MNKQEKKLKESICEVYFDLEKPLPIPLMPKQTEISASNLKQMRLTRPAFKNALAVFASLMIVFLLWTYKTTDNDKIHDTKWLLADLNTSTYWQAPTDRLLIVNNKHYMSQLPQITTHAVTDPEAGL